MSQTPDLRVRRTQKMLHQAFVELLLEENFESMTVQKLAERAMINRATFYRHYADKFDLAEQVFLSLIEEHMQSLREAESDPGDGEPYFIGLLLFEHLAQYADIYLKLMSGFPRFRELVRNTSEQQMQMMLQRYGLDETQVSLPLPLVLRYMTTAQMGMVEWWLEEGQPLPPEQMAQHLLQLHWYGGFAPLNLPSIATNLP